MNEKSKGEILSLFCHQPHKKFVKGCERVYLKRTELMVHRSRGSLLWPSVNHDIIIHLRGLVGLKFLCRSLLSMEQYL